MKLRLVEGLLNFEKFASLTSITCSLLIAIMDYSLFISSYYAWDNATALFVIRRLPCTAKLAYRHGARGLQNTAIIATNLFISKISLDRHILF